MAQRAARSARAELAAAVCVHKFALAEGAAKSLAMLKEISPSQRDDFIKDGGWARLTGMQKSVPGAVGLCADELIAMDRLPPQQVKIEPAASGDS